MYTMHQALLYTLCMYELIQSLQLYEAGSITNSRLQRRTLKHSCQMVEPGFETR